MGKPAGLENEDAIPWGQRIDKRSLSRAGPGGRKDNDRALGAKHLSHALENFPAEIGEVRAAMVDRRLGHREQDAFRDVGWTRNLKEVAPCVCHEYPLEMWCLS